MNKKRSKEKLDKWQTRLSSQEDSYSEKINEMEKREDLYKGSRELTAIVTGDTKTIAVHVRNIIAENIEAQVDSNIPQPKVTAMRKEDEILADTIEAMLRNELDRMPFEVMNDMMARTVPIQGGGMWLCEWDNTKRTHVTIGEMCVSTLHPKQVIPQDGVYDKIEDMDYIFIKLPQTKEYISRKYGVNVSEETESEPEIKGYDDNSGSEDMVTQYIAYYRNDFGGIGIFSWVNDTVLEDLEDYQARRLRRCVKCGMNAAAFFGESSGIEPLEEQTKDGTPPFTRPGRELPSSGAVGLGTEIPEDIEIPDDKPSAWNAMRSLKPNKKGACIYCGSAKFEESEEEYEEIYAPVMRSFGEPIPGADMLTGEPTRIPYYKPNIYPVILQRNVSVFGRFLGESDADKVTDQQNTTNIIHGNIIEKLLASGSFMTLPNKASIKLDPVRKKVFHVENQADMNFFKSIDCDENIAQDLEYLQQVYEEARQAIGITDSFQGRKDQTATSGKAKEFAAAQSAGRFESKRVMKNAAFAALFEAMFKFKLAYADEARPVVSQDMKGNKVYTQFNRYDFLLQDDAGEWYWNDRFLFSCDTSAPLAGNRAAMWQETRLNLQTGAFEPTPANLLFWMLMERDHYPNSKEAKSMIAEQLEQMQALQQMQQQQTASESEKQRAIADVKRQAREDAMNAMRSSKAVQMGKA